MSRKWRSVLVLAVIMATSGICVDGEEGEEGEGRGLQRSPGDPWPANESHVPQEPEVPSFHQSPLPEVELTRGNVSGVLENTEGNGERQPTTIESSESFTLTEEATTRVVPVIPTGASADEGPEVSPKSFSTVENSTRSLESKEESTTKKEPIWQCPNITKPGMECSCDFPHTLRCIGDRTALQVISKRLRSSRPGTISVLDLTVTGISVLPERFMEDVSLLGLVFSSGELHRVDVNAFTALKGPLQALGFPNNLLDAVPTGALTQLTELEQLDLSHNKLKTLEANSFKGLSNLTYLDLSDNLLSQLSPQAFTSLPILKVLRMRGNRLSVSALSALRGLRRLEELDLSNNLLLGPLGPNLLPKMPMLYSLSVSENQLVNVQQGALVGLKNLTYLSLSHNQIDVLEDHSFKHLSTLTSLDLANNQIVAVSSASLAHLENLVSLNLTHNFLRSLTTDLIVPLKSLEDLRLDDNDITMISSDVSTSKLRLQRLSLADNPLNCDCTLLEFANWLNNSSLSEEDKASAVCATPPALENGLLTEVAPESFLCGDPRGPLPILQLNLKDFQYQRSTGINFLWYLEPCAERYTCDNLIIYEAIGDSEIQTDSSSLHCDSRLMRDPCFLPVAIPASMGLLPDHQYRFCVVILIPTAYDDVSLGLGCSDIITLNETKIDHLEVKNEETSLIKSSDSDGKITGVHVNVSDQGFLHVDVNLSIPKPLTSCILSIVVFDTESAIHRQKFNCSLPYVTLSVVLPGRYKVCASLDEILDEDIIADTGNTERLRCVEVQGFKQNFQVIILAIVAASCAILVTIVVITRSIIKKLRHPRIPAQCFLPAQEFEITHKAHYIKLLATTKV